MSIPLHCSIWFYLEDLLSLSIPMIQSKLFFFFFCISLQGIYIYIYICILRFIQGASKLYRVAFKFITPNYRSKQLTDENNIFFVCPKWNSSWPIMVAKLCHQTINITSSLIVFLLFEHNTSSPIPLSWYAEFWTPLPQLIFPMVHRITIRWIAHWSSQRLRPWILLWLWHPVKSHVFDSTVKSMSSTMMHCILI